MTQHRKGLAADLVLLLGGEAVSRQGKKPASGILALFSRQLRQALQQPMDEKPPLEAVAPTDTERREGGGLGLAWA